VTKCTVCNEDFSPRNRLHKTRSKECSNKLHKKNNKSWRQRNPEKVKEIEKRRYLNNLEERRGRSRAFRKEHPEKVSAWGKRHYRANIEERKEYDRQRSIPGTLEYIKDKCRNKTEWAITSGKLQKLPCEVCMTEKVHAHHDDYNKPYAVRWLCPRCHGKKHAQERIKYS